MWTYMECQNCKKRFKGDKDGLPCPRCKSTNTLVFTDFAAEWGVKR